MSFSMDVKEELRKKTGNARHCRIAELTALTIALARPLSEDGGLEYRTETGQVAEQIAALIEKLFHEIPALMVVKNGRKSVHLIQMTDASTTDKMLETMKLSANDLRQGALADGVLLQRSCCKRAFVRGIFLAAGSITDPQKSYHFELVFAHRKQAEQLQKLLKSFDVDAGIVARKNASVLYVKEGSQISDLLNVMEAHIALMELENVRILKEMRNSINRQVNCETANLNKTVTAAARQMEDIILIRDTIGFDELKDELKEMAQLRLEYPESSLKELGTLLSVPIGRSGVNHRLAKLCEIAEGLKTQRQERGNKGGNQHDDKENHN